MAKYYLAYGSNLSVRQMLDRCPYAVYVGVTELKDWRLLFRGSGSGSYLTIEQAKGYTVPCLVWKVTDYDEKMLDRYEGYPIFYEKVDFTVMVANLIPMEVEQEVDAFAYVMTGNRPLGTPSRQYWKICLDGYRFFGFDEEILKEAYIESASYESMEEIY